MLTRLLSILFFLFFALSSQAQETPKTLLWRISGNNFTRPSYLYGTMHTADKRVYFLGDSVYNSISFCDGFAMEIDPRESIDTFLNSLESKALNIGYRNSIENSLVKKDSGSYKRKQWELDSAYTKLRQRYYDLSSRDIARLRKAYRQRDRNDMNTTFDLYLFDLAKTQGKIMGGLEDISGRSAMLDEIGNSFDPDLFLKNQRKKYVDVFEWLIVNYTAAELDKLHEFSKLGQTAREISIMLNNRNDIMAKRIDSLGQIRSTFSAVGAAHLPGDSGVINLLIQKGFTVEPVFSTKRIEPGDYKIPKRVHTLISVSDPDSNYIVQMPGKPTELIGITQKLFVKMYKELSNEIMLMCGVYEDGNMNKTLEKEVDEIKTAFRWNDVKLNSTNKITRQGLAGYEINFKGEAGHARLHIFYNNGKTYMFGSGSKNKDSLESIRCKNYMATYVMKLEQQKTEAEMVTFESRDKAFSVALPTRPQKETINGSITHTKEDVTLFSSIDTKKKISYLVLLKEPFKGYYNDFDSSLFTQTTNDILKGVSVLNIAEENVMLDNYPALKIRIRAMADAKIQVIYCVLVMRHNRLYNLTARGLAVSGNELLFDNFINSFKFLPYQATLFQQQAGGNNLFTAMSPSPIRVLKNKIAGAGNRTDYYAYDSSTAMSYGITAIGFHKYYWASDATTLLDEYAQIHFDDRSAVNNVFDKDSLVYKKNVLNGNTAGRELLLKTITNNIYSRVRIMHYADSVFVINIKGNKELVTNSDADNFFSSFRFTKENTATTAFTAKTDLLIKDLQAADSEKSKHAADILNNGFKFPKEDLSKVLEAFTFDYSRVNSNGHNIPKLLSQMISAHAGDELFAYIKTNYPLLKGKREDIRMLMLNILSAANDQQAYLLLKNFLLTDSPVSGEYTTTLNNFSRFPQMASTLFPDLAIKLKDDKLALVVMDLANMLIDSNELQYSSIAEYDADIIRIAKKIFIDYREHNSENYQLPHIKAVLQLLAKINQKQSRSMLKDFLELQNYNLSLQVILAQVKNNYAVSDEIIDGFCNTPERRILLYDEFIKISKQSFFKGQYASQKAFAEAFTIMYTSNEIENTVPKYYELVAIKDATIKNTVSRYYVFKVTCQFRRSTEIFTSVIGPFSTNPGEFSIKEGKELYILYRKPYEANSIDVIFNSFIEQVKKMK